jgi:fructose-1,6-bisphosphatase/inositol monophosphatase family enzyme
MRGLIERELPAHGIVGEEHGALRADAEFVWVLDPIDGTKSFISGVPLFGTLIALLHRGRPILGVIDQPVLRERWVGAAGRPTRFCGRRATTRRCADLAAATLFATYAAHVPWRRLRSLRAAASRSQAAALRR